VKRVFGFVFIAALLASPALAQAPKPDGAKLFAQCKSCHTIDKAGKDTTGPNLFGVYGRKAGTKAGFAFSTGMKAYGKTWDDASLNAYLEAPLKVVKGGKMSFAGIKNPAQRQAVIDYLKTLK
jgi:cytochrome c